MEQAWDEKARWADVIWGRVVAWSVWRLMGEGGGGGVEHDGRCDLVKTVTAASTGVGNRRRGLGSSGSGSGSLVLLGGLQGPWAAAAAGRAGKNAQTLVTCDCCRNSCAILTRRHAW